MENDGYEAIQVGFDAYAENRAEKLVNKPLKGHFAKANVAPCRKLRELRLEDCSAYNVGDEVKVDVFAAGDKVDITGTSKGHGFTGADRPLEPAHRPDGPRFQVSSRRRFHGRKL